MHLFTWSVTSFDQSQFLLQRSDPIIHIIHEILFSITCVLLSRFAVPEVVKQYKNGKKTIAEIKKLLDDPDNILTQDKLFVGFLGRLHVKKLLNEGDISQTEYDAFFDTCLCFHKEAFLYAVKRFTLNNDL